MQSELPFSARLTLLTGVAGSGKTHRALDRIREATTVPGERGRGAAAPGDALLVLPTYAQVLHTKRVALSRWDTRGILDEPFTTFTAAGERFLDGFRVRALPTADERDALMEQALRDASVELFEAVADRPGFRAHALRLVKEVKQTGLTGPDACARLRMHADALAPSAQERLDGFVRVFEAYDALLDKAGLEDHEDTLRRLLEALRTAPSARVPRLLVVDGFDDFTRVEEQILLALAQATSERQGEVLVTLPFDAEREALFDSSARVRDRFLRFGFEEERLDAVPRASTPALHALATRLFRPTSPPSTDTEGVTLLVAGDAEDEADAVAREVRRIVETERDDPSSPVRGWRDVGVVVRRLDHAAPRFEAAFGRLRVPLRLVGAGRPLASEPVVRALRGPLAVLAGRVDAGRFEAREITLWLRWFAAATQDDCAGRAVDEMEIRHRAKRFPPDFARYVADVPDALAAPLQLLADARSAFADAAEAAGIHRALRTALERLAPLGPTSGLDADGRPRDPFVDRRLAWATLARNRVLEIVAALESAAIRTGLGADRRVEDVVDDVLDAIERSRIALPDRRLDAVNLMDAEEARFWELPVVVVAGLEEGQFPLRPREDVLLRDADRETLAADGTGLDLPLAREREARERRLFYVALTRARHRLVLSRAAYDDDGDPRPPSFFLRDAFRVLDFGPEAKPPPPGRVAPTLDRCYTRRDLRLFAAATVRDERVSDADRQLARAILDASGSPVLERAARDVRPDADEVDGETARFESAVRAPSVSRLNHAVLCRYRFFLSSVVGVKEDDVPFDGKDFDFRKEGIVLHEALRLALREPKRATADIARDALAQDRDLDPVLRALVEREVARAVDLFRIREARTSDGLQPDTDLLELEFEGVRLGEGDGAFDFKGKVDRVDRDGDVASVIDYKSSLKSAIDGAKNAAKGEDLQLPLYALAMEAEYGLSVAGLEWIAIRGRGRRTIADEARASLFLPRREGVKPDLRDGAAFRAFLTGALDTAQDTVRAIRAGEHDKGPIHTKLCERCKWNRVCRSGVPEKTR